jgi:S1-C subfamily serine protease
MKGTGSVDFRPLWLILPLFFLMGCLTEPEVTEGDKTLVTAGKTIPESILGYIETREPLKALELFIGSSKDIPEGESSRLYGKTLKGLEESYALALQDKRYHDASVYYETLILLTRFPALEGLKPVLPDGKQMDLLRIGSFVESKWFAPASLLTRQALRDHKLTRGETAALYDLLLPSDDTELLDLLAERGGFPPRHPPREKQNIARMNDGTVTLWVDRGIKVDRGKGTPDIVIGSGFFIDKSGYLLTNYHVIQSEVDPTWKGYSKLYIRLSEDSPEKIPARVVGWDSLFDLALVKVELDAPYVFPFAGEELLQPGQQIRAIGSPAGLMRTVTSGSVSSTSRQFLPLGEVVQVDVPINPGNSGGPLLNLDGEIVGVVFAGIEQFEGINFAIPGRYVKQVLPSLYQGGAVEHSWLGAACVKEINDLIVIYAAPGSPARKAGLLKGDILLAINDNPVANMTDGQYLLLDLAPGTPVKLTWKRDGSTQSAMTVLQGRPELPVKKLLGQDILDNLFPVLFGFEAESYGSRRFSKKYRITRVYSATLADEIGFAPGDLINVRGQKTDDKLHAFFLEFLYQGQKDGFLDSYIQLAAYLESTLFL